MTKTNVPGRRLTRRQFLKIAAVGGAALGLSGGTIAELLASGRLNRVEDTRLLMGTVASVVIVTDQADPARAAVQAAFDRMLGLESILSHYREDSQLSQLNREGDLANAAPELREVLARAIYYGDLTGGCFDVSIEALHRLYREGAQTGNFPSPAVIEAVRPLIDYRQIEVRGSHIHLGQPGMALTFDGLGKGYVIDQGAAALAALGYKDVLVEVGGDLHVQGQAEPSGWNIGIVSPQHPDSEFVATVRLTDSALTTSGDYENAFTADHRLNHILDPHTGVSPLELSSASVTASTACDADALSTSLMILGSTAGLQLVERLPGVQALMVSKSGEIHRSAGFPNV